MRRGTPQGYDRSTHRQTRKWRRTQTHEGRTEHPQEGERGTHPPKGRWARTHPKGREGTPNQPNEEWEAPTHTQEALPPASSLFTSLPSLPRPPNCFPSGLLQRFLSLLECRWKYRNSRKRGERATGNANLLKSWFSAKLRFTLRHEKILNLIDNFLVVDGALCTFPPRIVAHRTCGSGWLATFRQRTCGEVCFVSKELAVKFKVMFEDAKVV